MAREIASAHRSKTDLSMGWPLKVVVGPIPRKPLLSWSGCGNILSPSLRPARCNESAAPVDPQWGQLCLCPSVSLRRSFPGEAQGSPRMSAFVRESGFGVSADDWHCPTKLLKWIDMSGI